MSTVYGPIPSRRLGQSLGVDPIPFKTCNYNCIYCQLGRTTPLTNQRHDFFPPEQILADVRAALKAHPPGSIDYITFAGQGEPLLCASVGWLIRQIQAITSIPIAVITNGSLMSMPDVRRDIVTAEVVLPTVSAADEAIFKQIHRPWPTLRLGDIINGLIEFRKIYSGQLWLEVMLIGGINDTEEALTNLAQVIKRIEPDQVHLNVPIRPPAEQWAKPTGSAGLLRAAEILGEVATVVSPLGDDLDLPPDQPVTEAVIDIIRRHPLSEAKIIDSLKHQSKSAREIERILRRLEDSNQIRKYPYQGQIFWESAEGKFGETALQEAG